MATSTESTESTESTSSLPFKLISKSYSETLGGYLCIALVKPDIVQGSGDEQLAILACTLFMRDGVTELDSFYYELDPNDLVNLMRTEELTAVIEDGYLALQLNLKEADISESIYSKCSH